MAVTQVIEGVRPIAEAIRARRRKVLEIRTARRRSRAGESRGWRELVRLAAEAGIPVSEEERGAGRPWSPDAAAGRGSASSPRVWAIAEPYPEEPFERLLDAASPRLLVALDGVTDVGNLGSIARSADAAGALGLVLEHRRSPPIGPGALRASAGALEYLRVGRAPHLPRALDLAAAEGFQVVGADPSGVPLGASLESGSRAAASPVGSVHAPGLPPRSPLREALAGDVVWVFGSEERGLRSAVRDRAHVLVAAPRCGHLDSLGVAAAAAYLLLRTAELRARSPAPPA